MHKAKIFLVGDESGELVPMEETEYEAEDVLHQLLSRYPDLLPGDQIDPDQPRRWLLVAHELAVPAGMTEAGRWSLDHLFLDQDGIPTFVECKRSTDTRTRREVVAQMLDYAANGVEYWPIDSLRAAATQTAALQGKSIDDEIARLLDQEQPDIDGYWATVASNLQEHRLRLLFVADAIPRELRRLIEFLNAEMTHSEVLGVEIKQFQDGGVGQHKALAPRVLGLTEAARLAKQPAPSKRPTTPEEFLDKCAPAARAFFQRVLHLAEEKGHTLYWGTLGFSVRATAAGRPTSFVYGFPPDRFEFMFNDFLRDRDVEPGLRKELLSFGVLQEAGDWTLRAYVTDENLQRLNEVYDTILTRVGELATVATDPRGKS